jgi:chemotaxis-related protein WspD
VRGAPDPGKGAPSAVERLLGRPPDPAYLAAWARSLRTPLETLFGADEARGTAAGVFRLGLEHFAIETRHVQEVRRPRPVHALPGRSNDVFRGLVAIRGEIHLCACLRTLLGVEAAAGPDEPRRLVVVAQGEPTWAFEVDEVVDFRRFDARTVAAPQVTIAKSAVHYTRGLLDFGRGLAALLDEGRLFAGLARSLS